MLDMVNVGLRTLMCLGFILFVVRPMLMGMFSRETDRLGIEQAAELAVMAAFKNQFDWRSRLNGNIIVIAGMSEKTTLVFSVSSFPKRHTFRVSMRQLASSRKVLKLSDERWLGKRVFRFRSQRTWFR